MTATYTLQIHSREVQLGSFDLGRHTGYDLIKIEKGVTTITSIDLYEQNGHMNFYIQEDIPSYIVNIPSKDNPPLPTQLWPEIINIENSYPTITQGLAEQYDFKTATINIANPKEIFDKILFDAKFRQALSGINDGLLDYDIEGPNCNTWTSHISKAYLNNLNVYGLLHQDGSSMDNYLGWSNDFTTSNLGADNRNCKLIEDISAKFFASYSQDFNMGNLQITLNNALDTDNNNNNGFYAVISDGTKTYIFDGERGSWFADDDGNIINGTAADDYIVTGKGNDTISAGQGNDIVDAGILENEAGIYKYANLGAGSDNYTGGDGIDIVDGGSGNLIKIKQDLNNKGYIGSSDITLDMIKDSLAE